MNLNELMHSIIEFYNTFSLNVFLTLLVILCIYLISRFTRPKIKESIETSRFKEELIKSASHYANIILIIFSIPVLLLIWGFDFRNLLLLSTGILTLTGVALFANWSILSNVTAFFIILIHPTFRRGNFIRIIDIDNYIEGYIAEINMFNTRLITDEREYIIYPNNLLISRPSIINPRKQYSTVGKITDFASSKDVDKK